MRADNTSHEDDFDSEVAPVFKVKGNRSFRVFRHIRKNKKQLYGTIICLSLTALILTFVLYKLVFSRNNPPYTREEYARMTQEAYNKTFVAIDSIDLSESPKVHRKLLQIHIPVGPAEIQRRSIMRIYQIEPYKKKYDIDFKFVIGEPGHLYERAIKFENDTYGDIVVIPGYIDSREGARTTKTPEYYQYLENYTAPGQEYRFIGRLDTDAYVNFDQIFAKYLNETIQNTNNFAIIACWLRDLSKTINELNEWPQGSFYIFSWKMMMMYNALYREVPREFYYDDELIGRYLYDTQLNFTDVHIKGEEGFDFDIDIWESQFPTATRVHELKSEEYYLKTALDLNSNFTENSNLPVGHR